MADEDVWKRRFHLFAALRLGGVLLFLAGIAIAFSNLVRDGGWPAVGGIVAILGVLEAVLLPRLLRRQWRRQDR